MSLFKVIIAIILTSSFTVAAPTIDFPLNSQVPLIIRISEPYSYTFPKSTFSSTLPTTYTLSTGPKWLSLDDRTLSGTASITDVGSDTVTPVAITITATDSTGSTPMNSTLLISKNPAPVVNVQLSTQLPTFGVYSAPTTVLYHPSTPFNFKFDPSTFSGSGLSFYAVTTENTPMPSWVHFDGSSLSFSGQTPDYSSLVQPPQTFGIKLIASDVQGYAESSISFDIEVGVHLLAFKNATLTLNATAGSEVNSDGLSHNLQLDGQPAAASSISSITAETPAWLTFDNSTMKLSGTVPKDGTSTNITVVAKDIYGDTANAVIVVAVSNTLFSRSVPTLNSTVGASFSYNMSSYFRNPSDIELYLQTTPEESWLVLDSATFAFSGRIPTTAANFAEIQIILTAKSKSSKNTESQKFKLAVNPASRTPTSTASSTQASSTATNSQTPTSPPASTVPPDTQINRRTIVLAIVIPIGLLVVSTLLFLLCYLHRRHDSRSRPCSPSKSDISGPLEAQLMTSIIEIDLPPPVAKPEPLKLDTSFFTHGITTNEKRAVPSSFFDRTSLRRSQTVSAIRISQIFNRSVDNQASGLGHIVRSYSETAIQIEKGNKAAKTESTWRSTQDSSFHTHSSRTSSGQRLTRQYSNYSRKGRTRRSGRVLSSNMIIPGAMRESHVAGIGGQSGSIAGDGFSPIANDNEGSILGLKESDLSLTPIESFSVLPKVEKLETSLRQPQQVVYATDRQSRVSTKRQSRFIPAREAWRRSGVGHGARPGSISTISISSKRRSIGHGQDWMAGAPSGGGPFDYTPDQTRQSMNRNSKTWLTVASPTHNPHRQSEISALSEYSDTYPSPPPSHMHSNTNHYPNNIRMSIRHVPKSSSPPLISSRMNSTRTERQNSLSHHNHYHAHSRIIAHTTSLNSQVSRQTSNRSNPRTSRPVSRRIGSSPFFSGGSLSARRESRQVMSPKRTYMTTFPDSPTLTPEPFQPRPQPMSTTRGALENTILTGLREDSAGSIEGGGEGDSFSHTYGLAREGTRQLRSYIRGQIGRERVHAGTTLPGLDGLEMEDGEVEVEVDSRFESAGDLEMAAEGVYEEYAPDDEGSEGSWETHNGSWRDSEGNAFHYDDLDSNNFQTAQTVTGTPGRGNLLPSRAQSRGRGRDSRQEEEGEEKVEFAGGVGLVKGPGRRLVSVDVQRARGHVKRGSRAVVDRVERGRSESVDFAAYV